MQRGREEIMQGGWRRLYDLLGKVLLSGDWDYGLVIFEVSKPCSPMDFLA